MTRYLVTTKDRHMYLAEAPSRESLGVLILAMGEGYNIQKIVEIKAGIYFTGGLK